MARVEEESFITGDRVIGKRGLREWGIEIQLQAGPLQEQIEIPWNSTQASVRIGYVEDPNNPDGVQRDLAVIFFNPDGGIETRDSIAIFMPFWDANSAIKNCQDPWEDRLVVNTLTRHLILDLERDSDDAVLTYYVPGGREGWATGDYKRTRLEFGRWFAPEEIDPYSYLLNKNPDSYGFIKKGEGGAMDVLTFLNPCNVDLDRIVHLARSDNWIRVFQALPVGFGTFGTKGPHLKLPQTALWA